MTRFKNIGILIFLLLTSQMVAQVPVLDTVCSGAVRHYRVDGEIGSTYSWILSHPDNTVELLPSNADTVEIAWNYISGIYGLKVVQHPLNGCDSDTVSGQVIVYDSPDVYAGPDDEICENEQYYLGSATADYTSTIVWTTSGDGTFDNDSTIHPTYIPGPGDILSGNVTLTLTGFGLGIEGTCDPSVSGLLLTITNQVIPEFESLGPLCQYSIPPALPDTSVNGITGIWDPDTVNTYIPGEFIFNFDPDSGQCAIPTTITIVIKPLPVVYAGADQNIPAGTSTSIGDATATGTDPLTYSWTPSDLLLDPYVLNPTTVNLYDTTIFTLTVTDSIGCTSSDEVTIFVTGIPLMVSPIVRPDSICLGDSAQLFANASGGSGSFKYNWTSNPPGFTSGEENPVIGPVITTTYIIEVDDGFVTVTDSVILVVNIPPAVYAGQDQTIPAGTSTTIDDATASGVHPLTYNWTPAELIQDPTILHPTTVNLYDTTVFMLTVTDNNGCSASDTVTIFVEGDSLMVNPIVVPEEICLGDSAQLFANAIGGSGTYSFSWTSDPPGFTSSEENPEVAPPSSTTYILEVNDGFSTVTDSVILVVHDPPDVFAGTDQTILGGTSTTIDDATASGTEPLTLNWNPEEFLVDPTVLNPTTVILYNTTIFTLTVIDSNGCFNSDTVTIFVEGAALAIYPTVIPGEICLNDTAQLFTNPYGGTGSYSFSWTSDPPGFTSALENPLVSPSDTTTYFIEVNDGIDTVSGSVPLFVQPLPQFECPQYGPVCEGSEVIVFTEPGAFRLEGEIVTQFDPAVADTHILTYIETNSYGCSDSCEFEIVVYPKPIVYAGDDQTIAPGTYTCIDDATASGYDSLIYSWDPAHLLDDPTALNPTTVLLYDTTLFTLTVTDGNGCINTSDMMIYVTGGTLSADPETVPDEICLGDTAQLFANPSGGSGVYTFSWTSDPEGFISDIENPLVSPLVTTIYFLEVEDGFTSIIRYDTLIVNDPPVVYAGMDQIITIGTATVIDDATVSGTGPMTYIWAPPGLLLDPYVLNPSTVELDQTTVFTLSVIDSNGCTGLDEVIITVEEIMPDTLQAITEPDELCLGNAANVPVKVDKFISVAVFRLKLSYNAQYLYCEGFINTHPSLAGNLTGFVDQAAGEITLEWQSGTPVTLPSLQTITELVFTTRIPGQGQLEWYTNASDSYFTDVSGNPIPAEFHTGLVNIYDPPNIILPNTLPVCIGQEVTISGIAQGTHPPLSYSWIYPDGHTSSLHPYMDSVSLNDAGNYTLLVTDAMGCTDQKSIRLVVYRNPVALFHGIDSMKVQSGYQLEAGPGLAHYYWNTGATTENIAITEEGWYSVELISSADCWGMDSIYMEIIRRCIDAPNAFTPNGDGLNDYFKAVSVCPIKYFHMQIFNRWGETLFESDNITHGWDGKKNGVVVPGDTYVFVISYIIEVSPGVKEKNAMNGILLLLK